MITAKQEYMKTYYQKNKGLIAQRSKQWKIDNKERNQEWANSYRLKAKLELYSLLGGKCLHCGFSDHRALQIDHINGNGVKELRNYGGNWKGYFNKVKLSIENGLNEYQLLCANCNWIKRSENRESFWHKIEHEYAAA